jgi:hypothetical protein
VYAQQRQNDFEIVAVAVDVQGAKTARPWVEKAKAEFPVLIDREARLADRLGVNYVPFAVWLDRDGRMIRRPQPVNVTKDSHRMAITRWLKQDRNLLTAVGQSDPEPPRGFASETARLRFSLAAHFLGNGKSARALVQLRKARDADPRNWLIRKQIWAIDHPERFYQGKVDFAWQHEQYLKERDQASPVGAAESSPADKP